MWTFTKCETCFLLKLNQRFFESKWETNSSVFILILFSLRIKSPKITSTDNQVNDHRKGMKNFWLAPIKNNDRKCAKFIFKTQPTIISDEKKEQKLQSHHKNERKSKRAAVKTNHMTDACNEPEKSTTRFISAVYNVQHAKEEKKNWFSTSSKITNLCYCVFCVLISVFVDISVIPEDLPSSFTHANMWCV